MKATDYKFTIRRESEETLSLLAQVKTKLELISEVARVSFQDDRYLVEMKVNVRFSDADEAKKLHRKIMKIILAEKTLNLTSMSTNLTEVFE